MNDFAQNRDNITHHTELTGVLLESVEEVLREPIEEKDLARALDRARQPFQATLPRRPLLSRRLLITAAIATTIAVVALFILPNWRPVASVTWAEVVETVAKKPWLHAVTTTGDGTKREEWFLASRKMMFFRYGEYPSSLDLEQNIREAYNPKENTIFRTTDKGNRDEPNFYKELFMTFVSADVGQTIDTGKTKLVHQEQDIINLLGKRWIEHHFKPVYEDKSRSDATENADHELVVYVDPDTHLPFRWEQVIILKGFDPSNNTVRSTSLRWEIDYPETGPDSIYALGVPKNAKVVEHVFDVLDPEIERIVSEVHAARWWQDNYYALVVHSDDEQHWSQAVQVFRVWKSGIEWKIARTIQSPYWDNKLPPEDTDPAAWWKKRAEKLQFVPEELCDGKWIWQYLVQGVRQPTPPEIKSGTPENSLVIESIEKKRNKMILNRNEAWRNWLISAGRPNICTSMCKATIDLKPKSGPPNTVLLEFRNPIIGQPGNPFDPPIQRCWIAPEKSYLVMRNECINIVDGKEEIFYFYEIEGVTQSPKGQWFPAVVRNLNYIMSGSDSIMRFYYDFNSPMPDSLFEP
ncbi:MAG: hypothetical protein ABSE63_08780 [Thermoguttaceae bacterium]|jgi:hypothetical protein